MERNYLFDNAKITLMFLVVFGHLLELTSNSSLLQTLYLVIYCFHIPMFVLISGMFAKTELSKKDLFGQVSSLLIPLLVFEMLYESLELARFGELSHYTLNLQPYWLLWFLWSLFVWKLALPILNCFKYPVTLSLVIAISAGYVEQTGYYLGISRTLTFLPFFVLGYRLSPAFFQRLQTYHRSFFIAIIVLAITFFAYFHDIPARWFYGSLSYPALGIHDGYAGFIRLGIYGLSFVLGVSVLTLLPNKSLAVTIYGERSLYIYIWHGFLIKFISAIGLIQLISLYGEFSTLLILLLLALFITFMLASARLATLTNKLLFAPIRKMMLEKTAAQ